MLEQKQCCAHNSTATKTLGVSLSRRRVLPGETVLGSVLTLAWHPCNRGELFTAPETCFGNRSLTANDISLKVFQILQSLVARGKVTVLTSLQSVFENIIPGCNDFTRWKQVYCVIYCSCLCGWSVLSCNFTLNVFHLHCLKCSIKCCIKGVGQNVSLCFSNSNDVYHI